ncbi:hypothetical protein EON82_03000 [bacterium]|nr:MAG: hypothetical protein EON82_03000 [bacterium]
MTDVEKARFREVHARMQVGYARAQEERDARIRATSTTTGVVSLLSAFEMAAKLPPRSTSGLVEFYRALSRNQ